MTSSSFYMIGFCPLTNPPGRPTAAGYTEAEPTESHRCKFSQWFLLRTSYIYARNNVSFVECRVQCRFYFPPSVSTGCFCRLSWFNVFFRGIFMCSITRVLMISQGVPLATLQPARCKEMRRYWSFAGKLSEIADSYHSVAAFLLQSIYVMQNIQYISMHIAYSIIIIVSHSQHKKKITRV